MMEQLVDAQRNVVGEVETAYEKYKREPYVRRTQKVVTQLLVDLEEHWRVFNEQQAEILKLKDKNPTHGYFKENYYETVRVYFEKVKAQYEERLAQLLEQEKQKLPSATEQERRIMRQGLRFQTLENTINNIEIEGKQKFYFEHIRWSLAEQWMKISSAHEEILEDPTTVDPTYMGKFDNISVKYHKVVLRFDGEEHPREKSSRQESDFRLPRVNIPRFDGDYKTWTAFHDIYLNVVHNNAKLSNAEKMQFLKGQLTGEAAKIIRHLNISEAGYELAWGIICERYNNKRVQFTTHADILLNQPKLETKSANSVKQLHDTTKECLHNIHNLGIDVSSWGPLIVHIIRKKFDDDSREQYENFFKKPKELQTLEELYTFLETRFQSLEAAPSWNPPDRRFQFQQSKPSINKAKASSSIKSTYTAIEERCCLCKSKHALYFCQKFLNMVPAERLGIVKKEKFCYNCLKNHAESKCSSKTGCRVCQQKHNTMLHDAFASKNQTNQTDEVQSMVATSKQSQQQTLLATTQIQVQGRDGTFQMLRGLIDQGSQGSFITERAVQLLGLKRQTSHDNVCGMGMKNAGLIKNKVQLIIKPRFSSTFTVSTVAYVMKKLTRSLPNEDFVAGNWEHLKGVILADPQYNTSGAIDVLLGAEVFSEIVLGGVLKGAKTAPIAQQTELGWIVSGTIQAAAVSNPNDTSSRPITALIASIDLDKQLDKFWELEEIPRSKPLSSDDEKCQQIFSTTHTRNQDGTFTVCIPFKEDKPQLGESRKRAVARLFQVERKLSADKKLAEEYRKFMQEYIDLRHMVPVKTTDQFKGKYYVPHQAVIKNDSTTTKLRVVFDASTKTSTGVSLNETMYSGPRLQQDLFQIVLRWRKYRVVFTADVEKMYRQIKIAEEHQDYQRILWRFSEKEPIQEYKLTTVTYGFTASPNLAINAVQKLATAEKHNYPKASQVALDDFYVDDLLSGANSLREAKELQRDMINLMDSGGFKLRKWTSNRHELIDIIPEDRREKGILDLTTAESIKTLGIHWLPTSDKFQFKVQSIDEDKVTKRAILSDIASLYDPLGWLSPVIIKAKLILQDLWRASQSWDEPVDKHIADNWKSFRGELSTISTIKIPRWMGYTKYCTLELHGFSDASEKAYAAVIYSRVISENGIIVTLLISKTKVAPIKLKTTLPRLELCAAVLLSRLMRDTVQSLDIEKVSTFNWTDSTITLAWIKGKPDRWKTFVANRVSEIHRNTDPNCWHHVKSEDNPADIASRGIEPSRLQNKNLWWTGPNWLRQAEFDKPLPKVHTTLEEKKIKEDFITTLNAQVKEQDDVTSRFSSYDKLVRFVAYYKRWKKFSNIKDEVRNKGTFTLNELREASDIVIKAEQQKHFMSEIQCIKTKKAINKNSQLLSLNPFLDQHGVLRVGGRLQKSALPYNRKHPAILPYKSNVSNLVIDKSHQITGHAGATHTLANTRYQFWIIKGQSAVKQRVRRCITCHRYKATAREQLMGNLPTPRIGVSKAFTNTGVDYAGPISLRMSKGRGSKTYKGYFVIFICLATKAIHLELVTDLTPQAFIAAFRRFTGRRGQVSHLYSDNATYFTSANKILELKTKKQQEDYRSEVTTKLTSLQTQWHFIPPASPHFGGLWESGVKSVKYHLKRILGGTTQTFEELSTVLIQIEACLNSRPLCPLTDDPEDLNVLTPGHFLTGDAILAPPEENLLKENLKLHTRWQLTSKMVQEFWKKWSTEYLSRLQQRPKWAVARNNVEIGNIVLIKDEQVPAAQWALGRITEVHPGADSKVRVVTLKVASGRELKRPITKVCPLPITDNDKPFQTEATTEQTIERHHQSNTGPVITAQHITVDTYNQADKRKLSIRYQPAKKKKILPINSSWLDPATQEKVDRFAKIKRTRKTLPALALMLLVLVIPQLTEAKFDIVKPTSGLYIEHLGEAQLKRGVLRTELCYKTNTIKDQNQINQVIVQMDDLCQRSQRLDSDVNCDLLTHDLREKHGSILKDIEIIQQLQEQKTRKRRGILGKLMQAVFGVNDEVYADIDELKKNQQTIVQASQHQSNIMLSMITAVNDTENRIEQKINQFGIKLNKALAVINDMEPWFAKIDANRVNVHILRTHLIALGLLSDLQQHYARIIGGILQRSDLLDFISAKTLTTIISTAEDKLPSNLKLYHHPEDHVQVKVNRTHITVYGFLYIVEVNEFTVMKTTPIPEKTADNTYLVPDISNNILFVDYNTQTYFELLESEVDLCMKPRKNRFICTTTVTNNIEANPNCIIDNVYHRQHGIRCPVKSLKLPNTVWKHLYMPNTWLFLTNSPTTAAVMCNGVREDAILNGTGIIHIDQHCSIKTAKNTIKSEIFNTVPVKATFISPMNFSHNFTEAELPSTTHLESEPVLKISDHFVELHQQEEDLRRRLDQVQWKSTTHQANFISIISVSLVSMLIAIGLGWKLRTYAKKYWVRQRTPPTAESGNITPVPRLRTQFHSVNVGQNVQEQENC